MWIVQVGAALWVGNHGKLVDVSREAHKWRYKQDARDEAEIWIKNSYHGVEVVRAI